MATEDAAAELRVLDARIDELKGLLLAAGCDPDTLTLQNLLAEQTAERHARGGI